ncbi:N-formylglutamate deformylase [Marinicella sp. W31]|uniref:N-formylglutamate deformylase n=1 Tax=Marinicella sp. W31 TaxID=3023713 RepID=UPI0037566DFB
MSVFELTQGQSPLLISIPHDGGHIPAAIMKSMHAYAHNTPDRDLLISEVFNFHKQLDATRIKANISRYVVDLNRSSENKPLYPGQSETELCPTTLFDHRPIYHDDQQPNQQAIAERIQHYWQPYHDTIKAQIARIKALHGHCILIDAHSIAPRVPRFFSGTLPDINVGTNSGVSCSPLIEDTVAESLSQQNNFTHVINGRFKGGYITRNYGQPDDDVHTIQFEISQSTYLEDHTISKLTIELRSVIQKILGQFKSLTL